jgi:hypothetical protein
MAVCLYWGGEARAQDEATNTLSALTPEKAREVVAGKLPTKTDLTGSFVRFDALTTLTPEVAAVLAKVQTPLAFNGLTEISPETATVLAKHPPNPQPGSAHLRLNGIERLSPEAASALAAHEGKLLLYSLERLDSIPLAQKLARDWGEIRLGLTELSPEIAAELAKHRGTHDPKRPGLRRWDGAASILRLDNIERLSPETAEALAAHEGLLVLNGLTSLDPQVATSLAKRTGNSEHKRDGIDRTGTLVLNGLPSISTETAVALAAFKGDLVLKGIRELSPEAAAALAKQQGRLYLTGLKTLSAEAHAALKAHSDLLLPHPLPPAG